jgi:hypothetical protein
MPPWFHFTQMLQLHEGRGNHIHSFVFFFFVLMGFFINKLFAVVMGNLFCRGMNKKEVRKI